MFKKIITLSLITLICLFAAYDIALAVTYVMVPQGGTGAGIFTDNTILVGNGLNPISTTTYAIPLADGANGQILKTDGSGALTWQDDNDAGGAGGSGLWASTTDDLAIYPLDYSQVVMLGANSTSSDDTIFDVTGNVFIDGNIDIDSGHTYLINGSNVVNQDVTNGSSPTFLTPTISGMVWDGVTFATSSEILALWDLDSFANVSNTGLASGDMLHYNGSSWVSSSTIYFDPNTGNIGIGTTAPSYALDVVGAIQTDTAFYGDYWISASGNSMNIQPTGDTDDFFSFKTPADRPTIKREGGKYIYVESSNVNDVGMSFRKDDDHSGTVNYYKDENLFGLTSKDPLVFKVCGDYDDYVKICSADNIPELSVASSSGFKINAGGTNALLLNHAGGNVGIGTATPAYTLDVYGDIFANGSYHGTWIGEVIADTYVSNTLTVDGYMQDGDINTFSELQSWVSDGVLLKAGTLTDAQYCVWDNAGSQIVCNSTPGGSGDVTDVFDCSTGDCNTMTIGTGEYLTYGTGYINANRFLGVTTVDATEFGYLNGLTAAIVQVGSASHDGFSDFVANEHLDWTGDLGAVNIHTGNYINTTYVSSDFTHDDLTGFVANEHLDWTADLGAVNIHSGNYTDNNTTYVSSDFTHDDLTGFVANEHLDWTASVGTIHTDNYIENPFGASIDTGEITDDTIDSADYAAGSIDAEHLAADIVDETKLADDSLDSEHYNNASVDGVHIGIDTITYANIADSEQADTKCIWFEDPTADDDFKSIWANKTANHFFLTEIWGESDQTVSFDLQIDDGTPADVSGTDIAPTAGEAEDTTLIGDVILSTGEELDLIITSVSGTPTWVSICWTGNWVD